MTRQVRWKQAPNPWNPERTWLRAEVSEDPSGALTLLVQRLAGSPEQAAALQPEGPGLPHDGVLSVFRARELAELYLGDAELGDALAQAWPEREIWVVAPDRGGPIYVEGEELRQLVADALARLPPTDPPVCRLFLAGDLATSALLAALSDRPPGGPTLEIQHSDSQLNHTPRGRASLSEAPDHQLCRSLSTQLDGFVIAEAAERRVYLCGLLVERAAPSAADSLEEQLLGPSLEGPVLRVDRVAMGQPTPALAEPEPPMCRVILAGVDLTTFLRARLSRPGWRWRAQTSWATSMPFIELDGAEPLAPEDLEAWTTRLGCPGMSIWIPGEGRPFLWCEAGGQATQEGSEQGAEALVHRLWRIARHCEEAPGALFGRGTEGWKDLR